MESSTPTRSRRPRRFATAAAVFAGLLAVNSAGAAIIGVFNDGRQSAYLSLLGSSSAQARLALQADGHSLVSLTALTPGTLATADIVWLPLLDIGQTYSVQERSDLLQYVTNGGAIIWIGDADVFNAGDDSLLSAFGMNKRIGNLNAGLSPALPGHPIISGPHGAVLIVGTNAGYGLFNGTANVAGVFLGDAGEGTFAGFLNPASGFTGTGRAAFICDASIFGQLLDQDSHRAFLRNVVKWASSSPGYTPSGVNVHTGQMAGACSACTGVDLVFSTVAATGETTVQPSGSGRCYFDGVPYAALPADFLGYAFTIGTTASNPPGTIVDLIVTYEPATLAALGIQDEAAIKLLRYDAATQAVVDITTGLDTAANKITGQAAALGMFLLGAAVAGSDCNANGLPDVCEIDRTSPAPGGPFYCTQDCDPDCNGNGVPDACDIAGGHSQDCNANGVPDECEPSVALTFSSDPVQGGVTTPADANDYRPCTVVPLAILPNEGYCFTGWTVSAGLPPADPSALQTTIVADVDKIVVAHLVPLITHQPVDVTVCEGGAATFTVEVNGEYADAVEYQWRRNGEPLSDGQGITGATTATLHIEPVAPPHGGAYTCRLTHPCAGASTSSAVLAVSLSPVITADPIERDACPGSSVSFQVLATGTSLVYQWQFDGDAGFADLEDGSDIAGASTNALTVSNVAASAGGLYRCVVRGACGLPIVSEPALLTVLVDTQIASGPADQFACPGESRTFTVTGIGTNLTYQWQFDNGGGFVYLSDDGKISGATTTTLNIHNIGPEDQGAYRCTVFGICGPHKTSSAARLDVGDPLLIVGHPTSQFACPGQAVSFSVSAGGTERVYRWQYDAGGGFADLDDRSGLSGSTTATLSITQADASSAGWYRCRVTGACGGPLFSNAASLTVGAIVAIHTQPTAVSACPGNPATFHVVAGGTNLTYLWQFNAGAVFQNLSDDGNITGASTASLSIVHASYQHAGQYRCIVFGACGPAMTSNAATLTVTSGLCDCNGNGVDDATDIAAGTSADCNDNGVPDECDLTSGLGYDCNSNGTLDQCDIAVGAALDCNSNGVPDECDVAAMSSADCNADGIPDDCQLAGNDCNHNGAPDECDPPYTADAGSPLSVCVGATSQPLGGPAVASGSNPPYTYLWQMVSGPAGGGAILSPTSERPRFYATLPGIFEIHLQVADSSQPPCLAFDTVTVVTRQITVDAGSAFAMCADATSEPLSPAVAGGTPPYTYLWTVEAGSPSTSATQFTGEGPNGKSPTFTPAAPGQYVIRLTVTDSGELACAATDTLVIQTADLSIRVPDDFAMCVGGESAPLSAVVVSQGIAPLSYAWTIDAGSPDTSLSQFGGAGPASANPTFRPAAAGQYALRVTAADSGTPACLRSAVVQVSAASLAVDAGSPQSICVGKGLRLAPAVQGGNGQRFFLWSIEPGSPNADSHQFQDPHQHVESPLFVPAAAGEYRLRVTVSDSGLPPCTAEDVVVVQATTIGVNAGVDFTTEAFAASAPLGASQLVSGGLPPYACKWEIVGGPDRGVSQLSNANAEHPTFTPSMVGPYEIKVTITDAAGCRGEDSVAVEAISTSQNMKVNGQGRLFMTLQIGPPYARAEVRLSEARPGATVQGSLRDDGLNANVNGFMPTPDLARRLRASSNMTGGEFIAVVAMYYDEAELAGFSEGSLRMGWFNTPLQWWRCPGTTPVENGRYPTWPTRSDVGREGVDRQNNCAWVVLDYLGEFAVGVPSGESSPAGLSLQSDQPGDGSTDKDNLAASGAPLCGAAGGCGAVSLLPITLAALAGRAARIARRRQSRQTS